VADDPGVVAARPAGGGRVVLFGASLGAGGAERVTLNLAAALAGAGRAVELVLVNAAGEFLAEVPPAVRVVGLNAGRAAGALPGLVRYLRARRPAALIAGLTHVNLVALAAACLARTGTRVVVVEHALEIGRLSRLRRDHVARRLVPRLYPAAHAVVAVSSAVAEDLGRLAPRLRPRIRVIPNLVVTPALFRRAAAPARHAWLAPGGPPVVLGLGRLTPEKDFETLIDAFARVRRARPARLVILGQGPHRRALEARARASGHAADIGLPGVEPNPYPLIARAAVVALTSRAEGLPTALIEALALGTAVVATRSGGCPEILAGGRFGTLVPVGQAPMVADAIEAALAAGRPPIPAEAWAPYTAEAVLPAYLEALEAPAPAPGSA
jgi:glycosyltransferase involved in cell wall biosynthesis